MIEVFNNLNDIEKQGNFLELKELGLYLWLYFLIAFGNITYYFIFFIKVYKTLCFSKITFEALPTINPYMWPFSIFRLLTRPYFRFWENVFPPVPLGKTAFHFSVIFALETLSAIIYVISKIRGFALTEAMNLAEKLF
jgi:hypothetical protein